MYSMDKPYSYRIPTSMEVLPGQRVMVPFGRGNRKTEGIVLSVETGDEASLKPVEKVLDREPVLNTTMLHLAAFLRNRCFCTFYDAVHAMLPAGLWFQVKDTYRLKDDHAACRDAARRNDDACMVLDRMQELGGTASYDHLKQFFGEDALQDALRYLLRKDLIASETDFLRKVGDKTEKIVTLAGSSEEASVYAESKARSAPVQAEVLRLLLSVGSACAKEIMYFTGASMATLRRLENLGFLTFSTREVLRRVETEKLPSAGPVVLTEEQQAVYDGLCAGLSADEKKPALLYGVTGSGKTSVYIRLIRKCLDEGKSAILLVPEIALTPQLMGLMVSHFGDLTAILHSGLRVGERYDEWKRIRTGRARVVIGTRSAVFAPAQDLGLLILDEEQEHTYKSENAPRYHARDVAIWRGCHENALVLLGSATPSVESMYHAKSGRYDLFTLSHRYNGRELPQVEMADMRMELKNGNNGCISHKLLGRLTECVQEGKQAILFLNRRGSSRFLVCTECGDVPQCPRCSVSLTYHSANRRLMCHYCGHSQAVTGTCHCGGHLKPMGAGTQKVEQELGEKLPGVPILRMDADTVTAVNNHSVILKRFKDEKIPILLGTQMVAKGLDFENVTLVGVLDADLSLYVDHFRAQETTFSMVTQVVGRAGRGQTEGRALIQTMIPEHSVLALAAKQDYDGFYEQEISIRRQRGVPPFREMFQIGFSGAEEGQVIRGASLLRRWLEESLKDARYASLQPEMFGPVPAPVSKINNRYFYRLTVFCRDAKTMRPLISHLLRELTKLNKLKGIGVFADTNPYE